MIRLKELRKLKAVSQEKVAQNIGVSQRSYAYYENGQHIADYVTLIKLSKYFGVTIDYLIGAIDAPYGNKTTYNIELVPEEEDERKMLDLYKAVKQKGGAKAAMQFLETLEETLKDIKGES